MGHYVVEVLDRGLKQRAQGRHELELEDNATVDETLGGIVEALELPQLDSRGEARRYILAYQGNVLTGEDVLADVVPNGAHLMLSSDASVAAGRSA